MQQPPCPQCPRGYDTLAHLMALDPGLSFFRRFTVLNTKNLLYLQAELSLAEASLKDIVHEDQESGSQTKKAYPYSVEALLESYNVEGDSANAAQWSKVLEVRKMLKEHNEALLQHTQLLRLSSPERSDLAMFQEWLDAQEAREGTFLRPRHQWRDDGNTNDLVALRSRFEGTDLLTRWMFTKLVPWYHQRFGVRNSTLSNHAVHAWIYDDRTVRRTSYFISLVTAGVLPASSIIVLLYLKKTTIRMVFVIVYNLAFVLIMGWMVKARRADLLAVSTAFAAVQVAMIATNDSG
ncbi:hypothetical protein P170DRAFT_411343 [Aspergillus steynii IBT 23096]|uniref:DUF6594 domain-containing protein n=1 Tax=Aspergillus steynii IBT 23096 TaxID=1392250 RepID=A0A2I2G6H4_9EURO|nr:uncharacterized protein P170DRAFT_411343 [Aspergillus steynii IBT 23096]PLB48472.1 hypothetical protein P170DRAFT_411343 [Aspergillus steynii IBT 23096]